MRKIKSSGLGDVCASGKPSGVNDAHGHTFRDVMQRDRQDQLGGALQPAFRAFVLQVHVHVRGDLI